MFLPREKNRRQDDDVMMVHGGIDVGGLPMSQLCCAVQHGILLADANASRSLAKLIGLDNDAYGHCALRMCSFLGRKAINLLGREAHASVSLQT